MFKSASYSRAPKCYAREEYAAALASWPYDQRDRRKRIAVIGAGMAGLIAARCLQRAGHKVTIYEANNIPGGRVKTLRNQFTSGFHAEAGAMRLPDIHKLTLSLVDYYKSTKKMKFCHKCEHAKIFINNENLTWKETREKNYKFHFDVHEDERAFSAEALFDKIICNYVAMDDELDNERIQLNSKRSRQDSAINILSDQTDQDARAWCHKFLDKIDKFSLRRFLAEEASLTCNKEDKGKMSQGARDFICSLLVYDMHMPSSMAAILGDYVELCKVDDFWQIKDGMDRLPAAVASEIECGKDRVDIFYNARVIEISYEKQNYPINIRYENTISRFRILHGGEGESERDGYDLAIIAVPFSALRHIRLGPLIGARKRRAVRQLHYDNACKVLLEFDEKFWEKRDRIVGGRSITDLPLRQIHYPSKEQNPSASGRGVLLASYTWGEDSLRWTALRHDDRIRFAIRQLERVHGFRPDELLRKCIGGMSHSWAEDEFTSGAFAMFEPYQLAQLFGDIWSPEGRLHYCGEHTSLKHGWIEGAVESGLRVGIEVCQRLARDPRLSAEDVKAPLPEARQQGR